MLKEDVIKSMRELIEWIYRLFFEEKPVHAHPTYKRYCAANNHILKISYTPYSLVTPTCNVCLLRRKRIFADGRQMLWWVENRLQKICKFSKKTKTTFVCHVSRRYKWSLVNSAEKKQYFFLILKRFCWLYEAVVVENWMWSKLRCVSTVRKPKSLKTWGMIRWKLRNPKTYP